MNGERFVVTSLTGYTVLHDRGTGRRPRTTWYVLDRAFCHRVVAVIDDGHRYRREARARAIARQMNEAYT